MQDQYYRTRNTKLAVALATLGVPFHNPNEPVTVLKVPVSASEVQVETTWHFKLTGQWCNRDGSAMAPISADDVGKAWVNPNAQTNLPAGALAELATLRIGLEARDLLLQTVKAHDKSANPDVRYVQDALDWNAELLRKVIADQALVRLKTRHGKLLYVPELGARDHAHNTAKTLDIKL